MAMNVIWELDVCAIIMDLKDYFVRKDALMSQMGMKAMAVKSMIITVTTLGIGMSNFGALVKEHVILAVVLHSNAR